MYDIHNRKCEGPTPHSREWLIEDGRPGATQRNALQQERAFQSHAVAESARLLHHPLPYPPYSVRDPRGPRPRAEGAERAPRLSL